MSEEYVPHFKTRARLLCQLGEQLIKSESIALMELVKNAYDADSPFCVIHMENPDNRNTGSITIEDNGDGMTADIIRNIWLEVGTNSKADQKEKHYRTKKFNRVPLGEKGIGRFGVHRLGRRIELITRMENEKECVLRIDWDKIDDSKYIEDIPIVLIERDPQSFKDGHGTKIIISHLRNDWDRGSVRDVARSINSLNSPFESIGSFSTDFSVNNDWLNGLLKYEDIKNKNLYKFEAKVSGNHVIDFSYDFTPYRNLDRVKPRHVSFNDFKSLSRMVKDKDKHKHEIDISKYRIGDFTIKGIIFDLDTRILNIGLEKGIKDLKDYLSVNGGIKVFRDNMRIWDYGEIDNDWLDLDAKRINRPSFKLSNRLILAAVYLNSEHSSDLIEKTNREGFVDNEAYEEFKSACSYVIDNVELYRNGDKEKLRTMYTSETKDIPVIDSIEEIKDILKKEVKDEELNHRLYIKLDRISEEYTRITGNLIKSAGAGLNLISVLHQIEKIIKNLKKSLGVLNFYEQTVKDINMLSNLVDGYSVLVRNSQQKIQELAHLVDQAVDDISLRLKAHNVKILKAYDADSSLNGFCSDSYFINVMLNLFDNSLWWMEYAQIKTPKIFISISDALEGFSTIIVADNGPGFALSKDELGNPFVTAKPFGLGMGIGLHLTKVIMDELGGKLLFPEQGDFDIPLEFSKGAIVALAFKKEK
jgi:signal transduction histidine kinase